LFRSHGLRDERNSALHRPGQRRKCAIRERLAQGWMGAQKFARRRKQALLRDEPVGGPLLVNETCKPHALPTDPPAPPASGYYRDTLHRPPRPPQASLGADAVETGQEAGPDA